MLGLLIVVGLYPGLLRDLGPIPGEPDDRGGACTSPTMTGTLSVFMLLRAFSSGAVALSGVEAVSNGVPAFQRPESRNAARTLISMAVILGIGFFGISLLASKLQPFRGHEDPTSIAMMAEWVYGGKGVLFWVDPDRHVRHPDPGRQHRLRRLPPACPRSSPATASCPASSPTGATASSSPTACCSWPPWPRS